MPREIDYVPSVQIDQTTAVGLVKTSIQSSYQHAVEFFGVAHPVTEALWNALKVAEGGEG